MRASDGKLWTAHLNVKDVPWVESAPGMELRVVHYREDAQMLATQLRAAPGATSDKHRHLGPAHAFTTAGSWGHDDDYEYVPGSYIFEPVGVVHRFFGGPDGAEAFFLTYGESEWIDEETGEVAGALGARALAEQYFQLCEEQGLPRPNVLRD
jgi:quercetin dioxygenase-like cupin family protein